MSDYEIFESTFFWSNEVTYGLGIDNWTWA